MALSILTSCKLTPQRGREIKLISHDTGRSERFASLDELMRAKTYKHALAAYLIRFFQPKGGFTLETHSESPAGAGISGSSALMIATTAVLARFTGQALDIEQIRVIAQNVEAQLIKVPTGCQDYYPAMYGGVNAIHLSPAGVWCEPIPISADEMTSRFVLFYTGAPRQSGINNWEVFKQHINGDKKVIRNFEQISQIAQQMRCALQIGRMGRCRAPAARRMEAAPQQLPGDHNAADRFADRDCPQARRPRRQSLRSRRRRLRHRSRRRGKPRASVGGDTRQWWPAAGLPRGIRGAALSLA